MRRCTPWRTASPVDTATLDLPARPPQRTARTAKLELRFGAVEIARPVNETDRDLPRSVRLRLVEVRELDAPEGAEPLRWLLLTTHAVADVATAWLIVSWYKLRWTIEQLFRLAKSQGLGLKDSQMETAEGLMKLTAAALKAACSTCSWCRNVTASTACQPARCLLRPRSRRWKATPPSRRTRTPPSASPGRDG